MTWCRVFPTRRPDMADVSATSCDVGFFFSVLYVVSLPNCWHVLVVNRTHQPWFLVSNFVIRKLVLIYIHKKETKDSQRSSCSPVLFGAVTFLFLSPSCWRRTKNAYFPLGWVLYSTKWVKYASTTQNTTTQHTTINMSRSCPTLQRLCPLSLHG